MQRPTSGSKGCLATSFQSDSVGFCKRESFACLPALVGVDRRTTMRRYRKGVGFVMDELAHYSRLDRNAKARLLHACEVMERTTKAAGRRNGLLGQTGLAVLRCLLLRFHNAGNGRCCPSYDAIQKETGFCRQTVATALERLESVGVLVVTRRLVRQLCQFSGRLVVRQGCNLYAFKDLPRLVPLDVRPKSARSFPPKPRVCLIGRNHNPVVQMIPTIDEVAELKAVFNESVIFGGDWRSKARAMFTKS